MLKTKITELFGIDHPILQGGMMWLAKSELVSAVAEAGGLGFMTALTFPSPEDLEAEIRKVREQTDKPFGVNLTFLPSLFEIDYSTYIDVLASEEIRFVETAGRSPEPYIGRLKEAGITVVHKCTSIRHALKAQRIGCDAISIDGFECAGHPGEDDVTSLVLIPLAVDALDVPVIASGGFGDGRGLVAALALGADAVNMGTRFVATQEAPLHDSLKQALVNASECDTRLIMRTLRNTERVLTNSVVEEVLEIESKGDTKIEDIAPYVSGLRGLEMFENGDTEHGVLAAGQVAGLIHDVPSVKDVIHGIVRDAEAIMTTRLAASMV